MARIAGAADMGMSIGKLVASGNSADVGRPRASSLGWYIEFDRQICWIIGRAPMP